MAITSSRLPKSLTRPMISTPKGTPRSLPLEPLAQVGELRDDGSDRLLAGPAEQESRVEDHRLGAGHLRDPRRVVEHARRHPVLAVALDVAHEAGDRRVDGERDPVPPRELPELLRPGVLHPEPGLEVDLACRVPALAKELDRLSRRFARRHTGRPESELSHGVNVTQVLSSDRGPTLSVMPKRPTRIDLLELDIDLRLADLWREAADVQDWNLDVVAAFMRAAYGKGYCDALTEESPGSLCEDHGYRIPPRAPAGAGRSASPEPSKPCKAGARLGAWLVLALSGWSSRSRSPRCSRSSCSTFGRRRHAVHPAEPAEGPHGRGRARRQGRRHAPGRRSRRAGPPLRPPGREGRRERPSRLPRHRARPVQDRSRAAARGTAPKRRLRGEAGLDADEVPVEVHALRKRRSARARPRRAHSLSRARRLRARRRRLRGRDEAQAPGRLGAERAARRVRRHRGGLGRPARRAAAERLLVHLRRRPHEPRAADSVHHLGVLGRAGGLAAPLAARPHGLLRGGRRLRPARSAPTSSPGSCRCSAS